MELKIQDTLYKHLNLPEYEYGFADLTGLLSNEYSSYTHGISIIRKLDDSIIDSIDNGPTLEYFNHYHSINNEINKLISSIVNDIDSSLYKFQPVKATVDDSELSESYYKTLAYSFSHKMTATRAGLGWIGKTDLLISKKFGPRIRLASIITNYPLKITNDPIDSSLCGNCSLCSDICPAKASNGISWNTSIQRNQFFDPFKCREYCRSISKEKINKEISLCGKCVFICPHGRTG